MSESGGDCGCRSLPQHISVAAEPLDREEWGRAVVNSHSHSHSHLVFSTTIILNIGIPKVSAYFKYQLHIFKYHRNPFKYNM